MYEQMGRKLNVTSAKHLLLSIEVLRD